MKPSRNLKRVGLAVVLLAGLAACDKPGPAETAGKSIDKASSEAVKSIAATTEKVADKLGAQGEKAAVSIDDIEITAKVKAAIFAEPGLKTLQIGIDTVKGVVTLSGSVDSQSDGERVKALAAAVAGVRKVESQLAIKA